jgi:hypothetical protein
MGLPVLRKYPQENRTVTFDFTSKLAAGDTLTGSPSVTASAGLTITVPTIDPATGQVFAHVSGGSVGSDYEVRCEVNTTNGDLLREVVSVEVRDDAN